MDDVKDSADGGATSTSGAGFVVNAFNLPYHPSILDSYNRLMGTWDASINVTKHRCGRCWLKTPQCYCSALAERSIKYPMTNRSNVILYYHFKEIGRSANTGHILPILAPSWCSTVTFAEQKGDHDLIDMIKREQDEGVANTCILYPERGAPTLTEWLASRPPGSAERVNIVALDGTYPQAVQQMKFLRMAIEGRTRSRMKVVSVPEVAGCKGIDGVEDIDLDDSEPYDEQDTAEADGDETKPTLPGADATFPERVFVETSPPTTRYRLPLVKLDLGGRAGLASAITGVMTQPSAEKICTLQAIVMALRECGESEELCSTLNSELNDWIGYILEKRIKMGKKKIKPIKGIEMDCVPAVEEYMNNQS